jgi:antitoxin (DNA-binding transcriptional repressor) of toxin-antitoxin stability system
MLFGVLAPASHPAKPALVSLIQTGYFDFMNVATLQQFGQDLSSGMARVQLGESIVITNAGRVVARLLPPETNLEKSADAVPVHWPDFAARRRAVFGDKVLPAGTAAMLVNEDRGA